MQIIPRFPPVREWSLRCAAALGGTCSRAATSLGGRANWGDVVMRLLGSRRARRLAAAVLLVGFGGAGLVGCGHAQAGHRAVTRVLAGHEEPLAAGGVPAQQAGTDTAAFGLALYARLCASQPTANLLLSPASASEALSMLDAGRAGPTAASVGQLLRFPPGTPALVAPMQKQPPAPGR